MSGPEDLNGKRPLSSFFTPFGMVMMLSIDENGLGPYLRYCPCLPSCRRSGIAV